MINRYREKIINCIWNLLDWEKCDYIPNIQFVRDNQKMISDLSDVEFSHYKVYTKYVLLMFIFHEEYNDEDGKWNEIANLFYDIQDVEQQLFSKRYWDATRRLEKELKWLPHFTLEIAKFFETYRQLYLRQSSLIIDAKRYDQEQLINDLNCNVNIKQKWILMTRAIEGRINSNPLMYVDNKTLSDKEFRMTRYICKTTFDVLYKHSIPLNKDFINNLQITSREIVFQMFIDMIEFVSNKTSDPEYRQIENMIWSMSPLTNTLFGFMVNHAEEFSASITNGYYNWNSILKILNSKDNENSDVKDILLIKDNDAENKEFKKIPNSKLKQQLGGEHLMDKELYCCLEKLYDNLSEWHVFEKPCKEAFAFRLSGFNKPDNLDIRWVAGKALLGKIIRCLYENENDTPPYKRMAQFFGINANIAGASQITKGAKGTDKVVKLLTDSGFKNVDVFTNNTPKRIIPVR